MITEQVQSAPETEVFSLIPRNFHFALERLPAPLIDIENLYENTKIRLYSLFRIPSARNTVAFLFTAAAILTHPDWAESEVNFLARDKAIELCQNLRARRHSKKPLILVAMDIIEEKTSQNANGFCQDIKRQLHALFAEHIEERIRT